MPAFVELARDFVFGPDSPPVLEGRVSSVQTLSGSGALRVCAEALMHVSDSADKSVWLSNPSWSVHPLLLLLKATGQAGPLRAGATTSTYSGRSGWRSTATATWTLTARASTSRACATTWRRSCPGAAWSCCESRHRSPLLVGRRLRNGCVADRHSSAHNPTGVDPSQPQWDEIAQLCLDRELLPILDTAYQVDTAACSKRCFSLGCAFTPMALLLQGFASGNPDTDAYCVRKMVSLGVRPLVCQSFAKNMGLYGERVGCFSIVCADAEEAERVTSQVKQRVLRALWSFPPVCPLPNGLLSHLSTHSVHVEIVSALSASDRSRLSALTV